MTKHYHDGEPFPGKVGRTLLESEPAWPIARRATASAANVVLVVLDDVGFAQLGCFGSNIDTPAFDRLAAEGLRYRRFHTTAMCSPTRACLLTGRNHHTCAMGGITDLAMGFPGFNGRIPKACGFVPEVLRQAGWATFAVGKWHLAPSDEQHIAAPRDRWPLGQGFERFYGFLGGETNQFAPDLVADNHPIRLTPADGYHVSVDLVDHAIRCVHDLRTVDPAKPFFLYLAFGACHAPHHAPREWIDRHRGRFDGGWDAWREHTLARQLAMGIVPPGTRLSERPSWVQEWATLPSSGAERLRADDGGLRRLPVTHRPSARSAPRRARRTGRARPHAGGCRSATMAPAPRADHTAPSTRTSSSTGCPTTPRPPWRASTTSAGRTPMATTRGAGLWRATRPSAAGSARPTRAASATR